MIVKGPGYNPDIHRTCLSSPAFHTIFVGVSDFGQAVMAALDLVDQRIQLIELCGGFSPEEADELHIRIGKEVPVGVVRYSAAEQEGLTALFGTY
jgi:hypothetical protein